MKAADLLQAALALGLLASVPAHAATYDLVFVERNVTLAQTGVTTSAPPVWDDDNYYFLAGAEISILPASDAYSTTPDTFSLQNGTTTIPFSYEPVRLGWLQPYFYDGFNLDEETFDLNAQVGFPRQGGGDAPTDWLTNTDDPATDYHQQLVGNSFLLLAGDSALPINLVSPDLNFTLNWDTYNQSGKKIYLEVDVFTNAPAEGDYYSAAAVTVCADSTLVQAGQPGSGFSVVIIEDTFGGNGNIIQLWDGDTILANNIPNPAGAGTTVVEIYIDDPEDAHPWNGTGSTVLMVFINGQLIGEYEKGDGGYTNNYITLEASMQTNGAELATHTFNEFTTFWGRTLDTSLPVFTEVEYEADFASMSELVSATPAANYDFVTEDGIVASVAMGAADLPEPMLIKEYDILQSLDTSFDLTITWDPYVRNAAAVDSYLIIEASYWDEATQEDVILWETPDVREGLLPGIDPGTTSVTIPGGTLTGSPNDQYTIFIEYADIMLLETEGETTKAWIESVELIVPVQTQAAAPNWAGFPIANDRYGDTGAFLGPIDVLLADDGWVHATKFGRYIYVPEAWVTESGTWAYIPWYNLNLAYAFNGGWKYDFLHESFLYVRDEWVTENGSWAFIPR